MDWQTLGTFLLATVIVLATPGPVMAVIIGNTVNGGQKVGLAAGGHYAGDMVHHVLTLDGPLQRGAVMEIAGHHAHAKWREGRSLARRASQRGHLIASPTQGFGEMAADEPRGAGDQHLHIGRS